MNTNNNLTTLAALSDMDSNQLAQLQYLMSQQKALQQPISPPIINQQSPIQLDSCPPSTSNTMVQNFEHDEHNVNVDYSFTDELNESENDFIRESNAMLSHLKHSHTYSSPSSTSTSATKTKTTAPKQITAATVTKRRSSDNVDQEMLIEQVRMFPCLWNTRLHSNKEFDKRKNAWDRVKNSVDNGVHSG